MNQNPALSPRLVRERQQRAGVPARYHGLTMSLLEDRAAMLLPEEHVGEYRAMVAEIAEWLKSNRWALVLHGVPGSSKTALASALIGAQSRASGFLDTGAFTDAVREGQTISAFLRTAQVFVLDDVGGEYATYYSNTVIDRFVAECYSGNRRLVITTNMSSGDLEEFYSGRLVDRLMEDSVWLRTVPYSFRRKAVVGG